jgi:gluconate 2-dehydrogenase gamma chain
VQADPSETYQPTYFTAEEWALLTALVDRLIPADEQGPGALEAGVAEFIDRQMTEPYGYGALWYMQGPFRQAGPEFGYQLKYTPRDLYRAALAAFDKAVQAKLGKAFRNLDEVAKDAVIGELQHGQLAMGDIPSSTFFDHLWQNTQEGYFCDPVHGGNKGMAAWRMINFPGARADYMDWVEQYGRKYPFPPTSLGATKGWAHGRSHDAPYGRRHRRVRLDGRHHGQGIDGGWPQCGRAGTWRLPRHLSGRRLSKDHRRIDLSAALQTGLRWRVLSEELSLRARATRNVTVAASFRTT